MFSTGGNFIHIEPIKDKEGPSIAKAYEKGIDFFRNKGINTSIERLDNETSRAFQNMCRRNNVSIEYVPPGQHRANIAERMIAVVKSYLISALATSSPTFPLDLWDLLLPQVETTINLMRPSRVNRNISAYQALYGKFNFSKTPLAPPGSECVILERPNERDTWAVHGPSGYYIGPAMLHNKCFRIHVNKTQSERVSDSIHWIPSEVSPPVPTDKEMLAFAIDELKEITKTLHESKSPLVELRRLILDRANTIDEYISTYHPFLHKHSTDYTQKLIDNAELSNFDDEPDPVEGEPSEVPDEELPICEETPLVGPKRVRFEIEGEEIEPESDKAVNKPMGEDNAVDFINKIVQPLVDSALPTPDPKSIRPQRERKPPKHLQGFVLSLLEATLLSHDLEDTG